MRTVIVLALGIALADPVPPPVQIDVIPVDARGRFVDTLQLSDFEVLEAGTSRPVSAVRLVTAGGALDPEETAAPIDSAAAEQFQAAREGTRLFAMFLDEYHVSSGEPAARARELMTAFVDRLGPRDLILLAKPLDSLVTLRMTRDRDVVKKAIAAFEGRRGDYGARSAFEKSLLAGNAARNEAMRAQVVISALDALATHLGGLNGGRKALLFVSEGFPRAERRRGEGALPTVDAVIRSANRANVSIYPIDPRPGGPTRGSEEGNMLGMLASETDGLAVAGPADPAAALEPIVREASAYYLLTLAGTSDGTFHPVDVRVRKPGVRVRARKGYWAASAEDLFRTRLTAGAVTPPPALPRRASPLIRPWFGVARATDGATRVSFVWEPAGTVPGDRSRRAAPARIVLKASTPDGTTVFEGAARPATQILGAADVPAQLVFTAPPGRLRVQMSIEDVASRVLDTDVRDVPVAAFLAPAASVALGTPRVMRARTAREFRAFEQDPDAAPAAGREFSRAERLLIRLPAYAAADRPRVSAQLLSALGGAMRPLAVTAAAAPDVYQIDLPLAGLAAGQYTVEILAASAGMDAREAVTFRVTP
jgi:VWFA-related protein